MGLCKNKLQIKGNRECRETESKEKKGAEGLNFSFHLSS